MRLMLPIADAMSHVPDHLMLLDLAQTYKECRSIGLTRRY
jgi:hypothetical protein